MGKSGVGGVLLGREQGTGERDVLGALDRADDEGDAVEDDGGEEEEGEHVGEFAAAEVGRKGRGVG